MVQLFFQKIFGQNSGVFILKTCLWAGIGVGFLIQGEAKGNTEGVTKENAKTQSAYQPLSRPESQSLCNPSAMVQKPNPAKDFLEGKGGPPDPNYYNMENLYKLLNFIYNNAFQCVSRAEFFKRIFCLVPQIVDSRSCYQNDVETKAQYAANEEEFYRFGFQADTEGGVLKIISVVEDGPAHKAGMCKGDIIRAMDGICVTTKNIDKALRYLGEKPENTITFLICRQGCSTYIEIPLQRESLAESSVKWCIAGQVGYIRITSFTPKTAQQFRDAMGNIQKNLGNQLRGYILDLRDNPGGSGQAAIEVCSALMEKGVVMRLHSQKVPERIVCVKPGEDISKKAPLVVMINDGSASASEVVAGALQDHKRAIIVGSTSFGKGSGQDTIILGADATSKGPHSLILTTIQWATPKGHFIHGQGIQPDILLPEGQFTISDKWLTRWKGPIQCSLLITGQDKEEFPALKAATTAPQPAKETTSAATAVAADALATERDAVDTARKALLKTLCCDEVFRQSYTIVETLAWQEHINNPDKNKIKGLFDEPSQGPCGKPDPAKETSSSPFTGTAPLPLPISEPAPHNQPGKK